MDLFGDPFRRDEINAIIRLLWEKETAHELEIMDGLELQILVISN